MAVTYSNNFNNIIDKLMEIIKVEVPVPVVKATTKDPMLKANQSIRIIPNGSTLVTYASHMEFDVDMPMISNFRYNFVNCLVYCCSILVGRISHFLFPIPHFPFPISFVPARRNARSD